MRIGVPSSGRSWVSMGPLGWFIYLVVMGPFILAWAVLVIAVRLVAWACQAIAGYRAARRAA